MQWSRLENDIHLRPDWSDKRDLCLSIHRAAPFVTDSDFLAGVSLSFFSLFLSKNLYLKITVRTAASSGWTIMSRTKDTVQNTKNNSTTEKLFHRETTRYCPTEGFALVFVSVTHTWLKREKKSTKKPVNAWKHFCHSSEAIIYTKRYIHTTVTSQITVYTISLSDRGKYLISISSYYSRRFFNPGHS